MAQAPRFVIDQPDTHGTFILENPYVKAKRGELQTSMKHGERQWEIQGESKENSRGNSMRNSMGSSMGILWNSMEWMGMECGSEPVRWASHWIPLWKMKMGLIQDLGLVTLKNPRLQLLSICKAGWEWNFMETCPDGSLLWFGHLENWKNERTPTGSAGVILLILVSHTKTQLWSEFWWSMGCDWTYHWGGQWTSGWLESRLMRAAS